MKQNVKDVAYDLYIKWGWNVKNVIEGEFWGGNQLDYELNGKPISVNGEFHTIEVEGERYVVELAADEETVVVAKA